jgi:hypothetical protein
MKAFIGVAKCCGAITAAMVDDETTKAKDIGRFAKDVIASGREFKHIDTGFDRISMERCKCMRPVAVPADQK